MADKPEREEEEEEEEEGGGAEGWWQCGDKWASGVVAAIYNMEHIGAIFIFYFPAKIPFFSFLFPFFFSRRDHATALC